MALKEFTIPTEIYTRFKAFHELMPTKILELLLYVPIRWLMNWPSSAENGGLQQRSPVNHRLLIRVGSRFAFCDDLCGFFSYNSFPGTWSGSDHGQLQSETWEAICQATIRHNRSAGKR
jgi:hypothetical protein